MKVSEKLVKVGLCATALISLVVLLVVVGYVFINGIGATNLDFLLESPYRFEYGGYISADYRVIVFGCSLFAFCSPFGSCICDISRGICA